MFGHVSVLLPEHLVENDETILYGYKHEGRLICLSASILIWDRKATLGAKYMNLEVISSVLTSDLHFDITLYLAIGDF